MLGRNSNTTLTKLAWWYSLSRKCSCNLSIQLETDLRADPQDLDALKFVLNTIADICGMGMDIELNYLDTMERYRTLQQYAIHVLAEEMTKAEGIASRWQALLIEAKTKDLCLVRVKDRFREVTKQQAITFHEALKDMETNFKANGPGNPTTQLEDGVRLLAEYQDRVQASANTCWSRVDHTIASCFEDARGHVPYNRVVLVVHIVGITKLAKNVFVA